MLSVANETDIVAPLDVIFVEHLSTFPEGTTLMVSIEYSIVVSSPLETPDLAERFLTSAPTVLRIFPDSCITRWVLVFAVEPSYT
jgi:hypothetical protein